MILFNKIEVSIVNGNLSFQLVTGVTNLVVDIQILDTKGNHVLSSPYNQVVIPYMIALQPLAAGEYIVNVTENGNRESFYLQVIEGKGKEKGRKEGIFPKYIISPMGGIVTLVQGRTIQTEITNEYGLNHVYREIKNSKGEVTEASRRLNRNECTPRAGDGKCVHSSADLPNDIYKVEYYHFDNNNGQDLKHSSNPHTVIIN